MRQIIESCNYEIKRALLSLKQKPGFVFSVVTTMGMTLACLLCVLTLAYVLLIKPLPYPEQNRLYNIEHQLINHEGKIDGTAFTYPNLMHIYQQQTFFEQTAIAYRDANVITSLPTEPMVGIAYVSPEWFEIFAIEMLIGRGFEQSEAVLSHNPVVVISYRTWQQKFAGATDIIERSITLGGVNFRIVGVTAPEYNEVQLGGASFTSDVYIPWDFNSVTERDRRSWGNDDSALSVVAKLKTAYKQYSTEQISELLAQVVNDNWQTQVAGQKFFKGWSIGFEIKSLKSYIGSESETSIYLLMLGVLGLVIIASTNITNLFMARTAEKRNTLAIIAAVGANKSQLLRCILAETAVLMTSAVILAQPLIKGVFVILQHYLADYLPRVEELQLNAFSAALSLILVLLFSLLFGQICRQMINYRQLKLSLQTSGKGNGIQISKSVRKLLMTSQIVIAMVLIFSNLVLYKQAKQLVNQELGYHTDNITSAVVALPKNEQELAALTISQLKTALLTDPKIKNVSQAMRPTGFRTLALTLQGGQQRFTASGKDIDEQYFTMIGQELLAGDNFSASDIKDRKPVVIVNERFAQQLAPEASALGLKFENGVEIIGIVKNIKIPGKSSLAPRFYYPTRLSRNMLLIETHQGQDFTRDEMITTLKLVDKKLSLFSFASLNEYKNQRLFTANATAITTVCLAVLTIVLSAIGIYGILAYSTQMRRGEIGTRLAIGAKRKDIVWLVLKENIAALVTGLCISVLIFIGLYGSFRGHLTGYFSLSMALLSPLMITLVLISSLSFLSCYLPLRQYINKPAIHSLRGD